jgi:hypothetical protein
VNLFFKAVPPLDGYFKCFPFNSPPPDVSKLGFGWAVDMMVTAHYGIWYYGGHSLRAITGPRAVGLMKVSPPGDPGENERRREDTRREIVQNAAIFYCCKRL